MAFSKVGENAPAFPVRLVGDGLTKREYFAAAALTGFLASSNYTEPLMVKKAVEAADALIERLNEE